MEKVGLNSNLIIFAMSEAWKLQKIFYQKSCDSEVIPRTNVSWLFTSFKVVENLEEEIWKPVIDYVSYYEVSSKGRVRSLKRSLTNSLGRKYTVGGFILKLTLDVYGYPCVNLSKNNKSKVRTVHQLVAESFLGFKRSGMKRVVDHIDWNKENNNMSNLRITTSRDNSTRLSRDKMGVSKYPGVTFRKDNGRWIARIQVNKNTEYLGSFERETDAAEAYIKRHKEVVDSDDDEEEVEELPILSEHYI